MDLVFNFIMRSASYLITAYFIYSILGRRRIVGIALLSVLLFSTLVPYLQLFGQDIEIKALLLSLTINVGPLILALIVFMSVTGGLPMIKLKKRKLKALKENMSTKRLNVETSVIVLAGSFIIGATSFLVFEGFMRYFVLALSIIGFILSIFLFLRSDKIKLERIILCVGRQKEKVYKLEVPKHIRQLHIKDFYAHEHYIVDYIGEVYMIDNDKKLIKDFIYWIATGDKLNIEEPFQLIDDLIYKDDLSTFEKYHVKHVTYRLLEDHTLEIIKDKNIK